MDVEPLVDALVDADDAEEVLLDTLPLDEVDDDTSPLEDAEVETLPLEDEETLPLDDDDTLPLLPPDADEVLLVLDTPPVLVDDPPAEVDVEPLVLDVEDTTIPLDPPDPLPPPKKPPAKKPPPMPPPPVPPTSTGPPPNPPPPDIGGISTPVKAGGRGTGAAWLATVTTVGGQTVFVRVTMRVTTRLGAGRAATRLVMARLVIARFVISRFPDDSATWTAPPPMTAPPQAQAHSFARAIFTDMPHHSSQIAPIPTPCAKVGIVMLQQGERNCKVQGARP